MEAVQEECFLKFIDRIDEETLQENTVTPEILIDPINDTYETILKFIIEEEARLGLEQRRNSILLPDKEKVKRCQFPIDQKTSDYLSEGLISSTTMTFKEYLSFRREKKSVDSTIQQCSQFFTFVKTINEINQIQEMNTSQLLLNICQNTPSIFSNYLSNLRDHGLKASTILIRINSLIHLIDWIRMISNENFSNLTEIRQRLELERKLSTTIASRANKLKTKEKLIQAREWVEDGIIGVQRMMKDCWSYFDALIRLSSHVRLSCFQFSWAVGYTLASLWVFAVNARSQPVEGMTLGSWKELSRYQFSLSNNFKTSGTYKYQIIASTDILNLFVNHLRKTAIPFEIDSDEACLFPTYSGSPLSSGEASKKVTRIFATYGYHLTITTLRAMISTHVEDIFQSGGHTQDGKFYVYKFSSFSNIT
jgi:hypothetical protein